MKKFFTWALLLWVITLSSCGEKTAEAGEKKETPTKTERIVEVEKMKEAEAELDAGTEDLKVSTEEAKSELDQILNDL